MARFICIHGHFYQPPRENAWLEAVELQDSAHPYHDWNERITAECYGPNAFARILDGDGRIAKIVNNYARISFNFGPTLLAWLEEKAPAVYAAVLDADKQSQARYSGHGSAIAQAYNHMILPLANRRDKITQIRWGIADFEHRFGRKPEGLWLPETAVDRETLAVLADHGIRFTILSPFQAGAVRGPGATDWQDVSGGKIDPTRAYRHQLPGGGHIALFFYDGPLARAVAFERLLNRGEDFAQRLLQGFSESRVDNQLVHLATDGESYGHHHGFGEMGLAFALEQIEKLGKIRLTNYGAFLEKSPPEWEARITENTAWSCMHGVDRWRRDCGCNSGRPGWNQRWREPLRRGLDELRDRLIPLYEQMAGELVRDPWAARDDYIGIILDRSDESLDAFIGAHAARELAAEDRCRLLKLLELQRHALLMYTSCGWFFDEVSGPETVQVMQYAGRVIQLGQDLFGQDFEASFLDELGKAPSNLFEQGNGQRVYERFVKPALVDWPKIAAHYAVSSLFEAYPEEARIFCFNARATDVDIHEAGKAKLVAGRVLLTSAITREAEELDFAALHFGDHNIHGGVARVARVENSGAAPPSLRSGAELPEAFAKADFPEIVRLMDRHFGESTYSLRSLFRDAQRKITKRVLQPTVSEAEGVYRRLYEQYLPTMRFLADLSVPLPRAFQAAIEFVIAADLRRAYQEDEPNLAHIGELLKEAQSWKVSLDVPELTYRLKRAVARLAGRCRAQPDDLALLDAFRAGADLVSSAGYNVDLWQPQNAYFEMLHSVYPEYEARSRQGDQAARDWLERFLSLGERLGVRVVEHRKRLEESQKVPSVTEVVRQAMSGCRVPLATYRVQFTPAFSFAQARAQVDYLRELGISDLYASPILQPRPGSQHGYDICDPSRLNAELGTQDDFDALDRQLKKHGMGLILDTVPNHMGVHYTNPWWMDVLENGPSSIYASCFDIDWDPVNPDLKNKVLLPVLGDQYGTVLEKGEIRLTFEDGAFVIHHYETRLPIEPRSCVVILEHKLGELKEALGETNEHVQELHSILTALSYLPAHVDPAPEKVLERNREKEVIKRRIASLAEACPPFREAIDASVRDFNGNVNDRASFDRLDRLLEVQPYRLAYWRVATEEINYRRFFDINDLAAIRVELPQVFQATHQLLLKLLADGKANGLRIDHPDGLWDPAEYFRKLQESFLVERVRACLGPNPAPDDLAGEVALLLEKGDNGKRAWPLYVVVEKILGDDEPLPGDWAVHGTTGYDFLTAVNGLFVDHAQRDAFDVIYRQFIRQTIPYADLIVHCQKMIMLVSMASEVMALGHQLDRISERNRRYRDFTLASLIFAIREIIAALPIYRTYVNGRDAPSPRDRRFIEESVEQAKDANPRTAAAIFDFIRDTLLLRNLEDFAEEDRPALIAWTMKFQQVTGPVLAKGLEDTAFYVYNRLASLNEVGGHPEAFGTSCADFHRQNAERLKQWPHAMLASGTHDTKRGEDMRARLNVLSELPQEWEAALARWRQLNDTKKSLVENKPAPDRNDEYLLYQTLLGAWPAEGLNPQTLGDFRDRVAAYMQKAIKEAKVHTSWVNPNQEYDEAMRSFIHRLLADQPEDSFFEELRGFERRLAFFGYFNALSQVLLKLTSPGVPDFYQGSELWDFNLVDPDNRRPVDYARRRGYLRELRERVEKAGGDMRALAADLLASIPDGKIKLYVIQRVLAFRAGQPDLFRAASYEPLEATGAQAEHVCAFARILGERELLVVVPRLVARLTGGVEKAPLGSDAWGNTFLPLARPAELPLANLFTGTAVPLKQHDGGVGVFIADVLSEFPVALLSGDAEGRGT